MRKALESHEYLKSELLSCLLLSEKKKNQYFHLVPLKRCQKQIGSCHGFSMWSYGPVKSNRYHRIGPHWLHCCWTMSKLEKVTAELNTVHLSISSFTVETQFGLIYLEQHPNVSLVVRGTLIRYPLDCLWNSQGSR